ncbi:hypothetical protein N7456_011087 [Penicillium angulare]|uniref:Uncharacterized protein n=1 Tax=Penicillium angulare TaxID=116970 RepID=A0A9W9ET56_9EURO|nr:hypothetical protein N7456_011087 [Penicillium angulare]
MNWFNPPDFAHTAHNEPTSEDGDRQLHQEYHQVEDLQPQHKDLSGPSDSTVDDFEKRPDSSVIHGGRDELVRLQIRMNDLLNGGSESSPGHSLGLGEVMMVCKELLELLPVTMHRPSSTYGAKDNHHGDGTALPLKSINASPNNEFTGSSHDYGRRFNGKEGQHETQLIDHIALLQIATSYAFALQLIDCAIDDIGTSASNMEFVSLGTFNLASQPAMSTSVGAYMVSNMIQQLRNTISLLAPEYNSKQKPPAHTSAPQQESNSSRAPNEGIKVPMQAAMNMVHEKETSMLEKLANIMISPQ